MDKPLKAPAPRQTPEEPQKPTSQPTIQQPSPQQQPTPTPTSSPVQAAIQGAVKASTPVIVDPESELHESKSKKFNIFTKIIIPLILLIVFFILAILVFKNRIFSNESTLNINPEYIGNPPINENQ